MQSLGIIARHRNIPRSAINPTITDRQETSHVPRPRHGYRSPKARVSFLRKVLRRSRSHSQSSSDVFPRQKIVK